MRNFADRRTWWPSPVSLRSGSRRADRSKVVGIGNGSDQERGPLARGRWPPAGIGFYCREDLERQHSDPGLVETVAALASSSTGTHRGSDGCECRSGEDTALGGEPAARQPRLGVVGGPAGAGCRAGRRPLCCGEAPCGCGNRVSLWRPGPTAGGIPRQAHAAPRLEAAAIVQVDDRGLVGLEAGTDMGTGAGGGDALAVAASATLEESVAETTRAVVRGSDGRESVGRFLDARRVLGRTWARSWKRWLRAGRPPALRIGARGWSRTPRLLLWEAALECAMGRRERSVRDDRAACGGEPRIRRRDPSGRSYPWRRSWIGRGSSRACLIVTDGSVARVRDRRL